MTEEHEAVVDIETLGTRQDTVICSVGVAWIEGDNVFHDFSDYFTIYLPEQLMVGRTVDAGSLSFWKGQPREQIEALQQLTCMVQPREAALRLKRMFGDNPKCKRVWGFGAEFDIAILENFGLSFGVTPIVRFRQAGCMRTVIAEAGEIASKCKPPHSPDAKRHDAGYDAVYQARWLIAVRKELQRRITSGNSSVSVRMPVPPGAPPLFGDTAISTVVDVTPQPYVDIPGWPNPLAGLRGDLAVPQNDSHQG